MNSKDNILRQGAGESLLRKLISQRGEAPHDSCIADITIQNLNPEKTSRRFLSVDQIFPSSRNHGDRILRIVEQDILRIGRAQFAVEIDIRCTE